MSFKNTLILFLFTFFQAKAQLSTTNLPIFIIDTEGKAIVDEPKTNVKLKVIYNGEGKVNSLTDKVFHYDSYAGFEYRGSSSQSFPKKPYGFELRNEKGENNPIALCGLPKESDWILFASYNEKSLMHNVLSMSISRQFGMYASRTRYVEVVINGSYQGVYVLMEKVKVDNDRVDIANLKETDLSGDELTGGYIIKIDKSTGNNLGSFVSNYSNKYGKKAEYFYHLPKTINSTQKSYIMGVVRKFEEAVYGPNYKDPEQGYQKYIDMSSFVKMFIVNEVSRNIDGYRISSYFYKDKDSKNPKLVAGPPWDYDISYGNADYCLGNRYDLWAYGFNDICSGDFWQVPGFWDRMMNDPYFIAELRTQYFEARKSGGILHEDHLMAEIDGFAKELNEAQARNFQKWNILGQYVWPNPQPVQTTWLGEVNELKTWLRNRLRWLDQNMPKEFVTLSTEPSVESISFKVTPNPFLEKLHILIDSDENQEVRVNLTTADGRHIKERKVMLAKGKNEIEFEHISEVGNVFLVEVLSNLGIRKIQKAVKVN